MRSGVQANVWLVVSYMCTQFHTWRTYYVHSLYEVWVVGKRDHEILPTLIVVRMRHSGIDRAAICNRRCLIEHDGV